MKSKKIDIKKKLFSILKKKIKKIDEVNPDITKIEDLDSIDLLNILSEIEKKFKIKFSNKDYLKKNFGTISVLETIIKSKL